MRAFGDSSCRSYHFPSRFRPLVGTLSVALFCKSPLRLQQADNQTARQPDNSDSGSHDRLGKNDWVGSFFLNLSGIKRAGSRWFFAESARTGMCKLLYFVGSRAVLSHGSPADGYSQSECQGCSLRSLRMSANSFSTASSSGMLRSTHTCLRYREMRPLPAPT